MKNNQWYELQGKPPTSILRQGGGNQTGRLRRHSPPQGGRMRIEGMVCKGAWIFFLLVIFLCLPVQNAFTSSLEGIRGSFLDFVQDPFFVKNDKEAARFIPDGLLVIEEGKIKDFGPYPALQGKYPGLAVKTYSDRLIMPGFVDCHVHYPQTKVIAKYGNQLLDWLNQYIFPEELNFKSKTYAQEVAKVFLQDLLRNGTTTAQVFTTTFPDSVDAFFEEATLLNLRMIAGLTGIDRKGEAPPAYLDTAQSFYANSKSLLQKWHEKGRNLYAITPRFALGSTQQQLDLAGKLRKEFPTAYVNTHMSENKKEVAEVARLFPNSKDYLNVYEQAGLVGPRFTGGHSIYLDDSAFERMSKSGASIGFCPSSNLFLGSGLFKIEQAKSTQTPVRLCVGSDMGGGNYFSILQVLNDAYKVAMLQNYKFSSFKGLYLATLGGANALYLDDKIGNFNPGKEADFVVLDWMAIPELAFRNKTATAKNLDELEDKTFGLMLMGDERVIDKTYAAGKLLYDRNQSSQK